LQNTFGGVECLSLYDSNTKQPTYADILKKHVNATELFWIQKDKYSAREIKSVVTREPELALASKADSISWHFRFDRFDAGLLINNIIRL
jgi:hypothetical protein